MGFKEDLRKIVKRQGWLSKLYRNYRDGLLFTPSYNQKIKGSNNNLKIDSSARLVNCDIQITGKNNTIIVGKNAFFRNVRFNIEGNSNTISIADNVRFNKAGAIWIEDENCIIMIGENSTFEDVHLAATESNSSIKVGDNCMFANGIDVRTGDSHAIFDLKTKRRINKAQNIIIGDHVWIAAHVSILKGAEIGANSVVATRAVVTKKFKSEGIILAGTPAHSIRENISWSRERIPEENK